MPTTLSTQLRQRVSIADVMAESEQVLADLLNIPPGVLRLEATDDPPPSRRPTFEDPRPTSDSRAPEPLSPIELLELRPVTGSEFTLFRLGIRSGHHYCRPSFDQFEPPTDDDWGTLHIDFPRSVEGDVVTIATAIGAARRWGHGLQTEHRIVPVQAKHGLEDPVDVLDYLRVREQPYDLLDAMTSVIDRVPRSWPGLELVIPGAPPQSEDWLKRPLLTGEWIAVDGIRAARPFQDLLATAGSNPYAVAVADDLDRLIGNISPGSCWTVTWPESAVQREPLQMRVDRSRIQDLSATYIPVTSALGNGVLVVRRRDMVPSIDIS